jgi:hypothetical protein
MQMHLVRCRCINCQRPPATHPNNKACALSPVDYFMIINARSYVVSLAPLVGSNPKAIGVCSEDKFKGL